MNMQKRPKTSFYAVCQSQIAKNIGLFQFHYATVLKHAICIVDGSWQRAKNVTNQTSLLLLFDKTLY